MNSSDRLAALRRELVLQRLRASSAPTRASQTDTIPRADRRRPIPLSWAQQRLWFLDQLDEHAGAAYHMPIALTLNGRLDEVALRRTLDLIVQRHEVLRTRFAQVGDEPVQIIAPELAFPLHEQDLRGLPVAQRADAVERVARLEAVGRFDLATGPMIRGRLLRVADDEWTALITLHHIVSDGWSIGILLHEVRTIYAALVEGRAPDLPPLPVQYADYAAWQRDWLQGDRLEAHLAFWRQHLAGAPQLVDLPYDHPRPAQQDYTGDTVEFRISPALTRELDLLSQRRGATRFMTLLAAWGALLARLSGQDDLVIGTPVANRQRTEIEPLQGFFVNTLALRVSLDADLTGAALLDRVKATVVSALHHQELPFSRVVEAVHPARSLGHNPLFQTMLVLQNTPSTGQLTLPGLSLRFHGSRYTPNHFDLTLTLAEEEHGLTASLVYGTAVFERATVARIGTQYQRILQQLAASPDRPVADLELGTDDDGLPDPARPLARSEHPLPLSLVHQVIRHDSDRPAIRGGGTTWTYGELGATVAAVRAELHARGIAPGDVVAIHGGKTAATIAACLGVLDAGAVMLAVDEALPRGRQRALLEEGRPRLIIDGTGAADASDGADALAPSVPCWRLAGSRLVAAPGVDTHRASPDGGAPAYLVFTSGTTGRPKGIVGCHRAISHFVRWEACELGVGAGDRVAQITSLSFDAMLRDVFLPLSHGGTLCLPSPEDTAEPARLVDWLDAERITVVHTVPSVLASWIAAAEPGDARLGSLRLLCLAGEPLRGDLVQRWRAAFPSARPEVVNFYGPSETTMIKSFHRLGETPSPGVAPVGRPLPETQLLVLERGGRRCAVGEVGEIVIRTRYATLGYLDGSAGGFAPGPATDDPQDILYRTGDLGRYRADGTVAIGGRRDDQVKVRGVRVTPANIAAVIAAQPDVGVCEVLADRRSDEPVLLGFVVPRGDLDEGTLRRRLAQVLPAAEIPQRLVLLPALPLALNGKVDRAALVALADAQRAPVHTAPATPTEVALAELWTELLGVEDIGRDYDFFQLGGHSLLAALARTRIRGRFGVDVSLRMFFQSATLAEMSARIDAACAGESESEDAASALVPLQPDGARPPLFVVHPVTGGVYGYRHLVWALGVDQPVFGLAARGLDPGTLPRTSIAEIAEAYLREVRARCGDRPVRLVGWSFGGLVVHEMARRLLDEGREIGLLAIIDSRADGGSEWARLASVAPEDKRAAALADLRTGGFAEDLVSEAELQRQLTTVSAHQRAAAAYTPVAIDARILLLRSTELDGRPSLPSIDGWRALALRGLRVVDVPGNHYSILTPPAVDVIAAALSEE